MKKLRLALAAALLAALGLLGWWFHRHFDYVSEDRVLPPRGQASYDPLYAAFLGLKADGQRAEVQPFFDAAKLKPTGRDTLVFYSDVRGLSDAETQWLYRWVHDGGHLVVQLPDDDGAARAPLLVKFGVPVGMSHACPSFRFAAGEPPVSPDVCGSNAVAGKAGDYDYAAGRDGDLVYVQRAAGRGWIAVVSSLAFMRNEALRRPENQRLMLRVLQPDPAGRVLLIYSVDSEALPLLALRYGWPALLPLLLCLLAFLWRAAPRFGPRLPATPPPRRALLEHVRACAELLWRDGRARRLYDAVRADMLGALQRRHPAASRAQARELLDFLTALTGLPRLEVRRALAMDGTDLQAGFTARIATLMEIRKRL